MASTKFISKASLIFQGLMYVAAGINHFWHSRPYVEIMPPHYSHPLTLVEVSGAAEILCGVGLLVPRTRRLSAWGIIAMLLVYYDVHFYMAANPQRFPKIPVWALYARLPLQLVLMAWAWKYTRRQAQFS